MAAEPRRSQRVNAEVTVRLEDRASGITRDISPNGVYFVIGETLEEGQNIRFTLAYVPPLAILIAGGLREKGLLNRQVRHHILRLMHMKPKRLRVEPVPQAAVFGR